MDFQQILKQAKRGVHQTPALPGRRSPKGMDGWRERATRSVEKIKALAEEYPDYNWVSVARSGFAIIIDIDDVEAAKELGIPIPEDTFIVRSPRGGLHIYLWHTDASAELGNWDILKDGKPIVEVKVNNKTCASPSVYRDDKEPFGSYEPINDKEIQPIKQDMIDWIKAHKIQKEFTGKSLPADYHETFDRIDWFDHYKLTPTGREKMFNSIPFVEIESCPFIGRPHTDAGAGSFCTCITFGHHIGISCRGCLDKHIKDFYELCEADEIPEYPYYIYAKDDAEVEQERMLNDPKFAVELADEGYSGVNGADTLGKLALLDEIRNFPESVNTADTQARYSDAGNAIRLAKMCGNDILYCRQADEYYVWDGTRWIRDLNNVFMLRMAKAVTEAMFEEAKSLGDEEAKALRAHALKSQYASRLTAMVSLAKLNVRNVNRGDFDKDPWLLNVLNGTVDLKMGTCRPQHRDDLISKIAPVKFDPTADCPLWKKCLRDWMVSDQAKVDYLQRQGGYVLTGCTNEETMPILWGAGRNGKTKFYATIYNILGDGEYAKAANFDSFVVKKGDEGMPNDIAGWCGMRLIVAAEGEHSKRLAEAKLKLCIGRDPVVGEFKYQEEFSYVPTFKVWLITNPKPRIVGTGDAIWERIHFVAWKRFFREEERDQHLQEKLDAEASGILNWLIAGCLQWQEMGLALPESMREDTRNYRHEQDVVGRFIDEEGVLGEEFTSGKKITYMYFKEWAEDAGEHYTMTQVEFNEKMLYKFAEGRSKNGRFWKGFKLKRQESEFEATLAARGLTPEAVEDAIQ